MRTKPIDRKIWYLGTLYYLGSIENAPDGPPGKMLKKLLEAVKARSAGNQSADLASLDEMKVLALDLLGYYTRRRLRVPAHMTMLFGLLLGLSEAHVKNPHEFLETRRGAGRPLNAGNARDVAFFIDVAYWQEHGEMMSLRQLSKLVADRLGVPPEESAAPASLRKWREEYVNIFDMKGVAKFD